MCASCRSRPRTGELFSIHDFSSPPFRSVDVPESSSGTSNSTVQRRGVKVSGPIHFASVTQSEGAQTTYQFPAFLPGRGDRMQLACIPDRSISSLVHDDTNDEADSARYETV